ncbi:dihydropteroate synthase [Cryobacterium sp. Y62]|uniref:dihydropteroate synthase n=1 Tax=Cryobacterium sp. Y62 TaxID=2048284 RepID=UPI000CE47AFC|nr:dihydropteroate synthase [Cryobacterium sp. Y62]
MTLIMGVLNVTPDSFSDGGRWAATDDAIEHGLLLHAQGADLIDVGGESTRPGATRITPAEEQNRVIPVVTELARQGLCLSIDTLNAATARAAAKAGASIINDVSGGLADPDMAAVVDDTGLNFVVMHWRAHAQLMDTVTEYDNVVTDVMAALSARVDVLTAAGVARERIVLDPGLGFSKKPEHNWQLINRLDAFVALGLPILVGASRKRFLADVLPVGTPVLDRDLPTAVVSVLAAQAGVWAVRVHDVAGTRAALNVLSCALQSTPLAANELSGGAPRPTQWNHD